MWDRLAVRRVGLSLRKIEEVGLASAVRSLEADGYLVANVVECGWLDVRDRATWRPTTDRWLAAIEALAGFAPWCLVVTTGPGYPLDWERSVGALEAALAPVQVAAADAGVAIAIENTGSLRVDLSFVFTLADALDIASHLGITTCMEVNSCWAERGLDESIERGVAGGRLAHVQLSDYVIGSTSTPDRAVPGDGDIPLPRIVASLLDAGYSGAFELELVGPRIESEGYESAVGRGLVAIDRILRSHRSGSEHAST